MGFLFCVYSNDIDVVRLFKSGSKFVLFSI